ncbi:hypothetical protein JTB14_028618 [Gonioctena quinquepunctata]|nr:hypothetical protein JTB14_028618 [Gonioctena quinquepunctata]
MTRKYQGERNILRNQIRILRDVSPSSPELVVKVAKEDFPALRPGRRHEQRPNPIKGKGKLINRPNIEISNRFGVLENEGTSEPDTEKEIEAETSQEWAQVKGKEERWQEGPKPNTRYSKTAGGPSSPKTEDKTTSRDNPHRNGRGERGHRRPQQPKSDVKIPSKSNQHRNRRGENQRKQNSSKEGRKTGHVAGNVIT